MQPPPIHPHMPMDPNYRWWVNNYSWWFQSGGNVLRPQDQKVNRVAYGLVSTLLRDKMGPDYADKLKSITVKVFDFSGDGDIASLFETMVGKIEYVKGNEATYHLIAQKMHPSQMIAVLNGLQQQQPKEAIQQLQAFINDGGRVLFFFCTPFIIGTMFPGKIQPSPPSTCIKSVLKITGEKELFSGFKSKAAIQLETYRHPLDVIDKKSVSILATTVGSRGIEPLVLKFNSGNGVVYIFQSKLVLADKIIQEKQTTIAPTVIESYVQSQGGSKDTVTAWQCAVKVGFIQGYEYALQVTPLLDLISKILLKEKAFTDQIPQPQAMQGDQESENGDSNFETGESNGQF